MWRPLCCCLSVRVHSQSAPSVRSTPSMVGHSSTEARQVMNSSVSRGSSAVARPGAAMGSSVLAFVMLVAVAGCDGGKPVASVSPKAAPGLSAATVDKYDIAELELKSPLAVVSAERHKGAFAAGEALNLDASLKAVDPAPVKTIQLDTTHKIIEIAPGVRFSRVDLRRPGARSGDSREGRRPHQVLDDQPQRRDCAGCAGDRRADDALDGFPCGDGLAAGQVPLDRARARPSASSSRSTIPAYSCTTAGRRWCSSTSPPACTA